MPRPLDKYENLKRNISRTESVAVAFSGGADSALLLKAAHDALGERAIAVTVLSHAFPREEADDARRICRGIGARHETVEFDVLSVPMFAENPPDRCYHCKKAIFTAICGLAKAKGLSAVVEGSNTDDDGDYRPGRRAIAELGVMSPLRDAGLSKGEIRECLRELGVSAGTRPSSACLASRFPYGERITREGLLRVGEAERFLRGIAPELSQLRVRSHGAVARIEADAAATDAIFARRGECAAELRRLGFSYVALDLNGYRTGSLNEVL